MKTMKNSNPIPDEGGISFDLNRAADQVTESTMFTELVLCKCDSHLAWLHLRLV